MPDVGVQIPPNLADWWLPLVDEGATDLGGLSANGDHISPEHPFPSPHKMRRALADNGHALAERLCVYPQYMDSEWLEQGVLDVIKAKYWSFIPRRGSGRREERAIRSDLVPGAIARARDGREPSAPDELTALFAETRPEAIEDMRQAADELRAELAGDTVTFVVNRNINVSNICTVGCAFCGFGQGKRSPDAYEHDREEFERRVREAVEFGATEICMQSGIHPDWGLEEYEHWLRVAKEVAPELHLHAYSAMEVDHMCEVVRPAAARGLPPPARGRASTPRPAPPPRCSTTACASASPRTSCRWRAGWRSSRPRTPPGLRSTVTVMFGHIEEPWELAEHMRVVRELQERTGGFTEFVPLSLHPVPDAARAAPTGSRRSRARRTSSTRPPSGSRSAARSRACRRAG